MPQESTTRSIVEELEKERNIAKAIDFDFFTPYIQKNLANLFNLRSKAAFGFYTSKTPEHKKIYQEYYNLCNEKIKQFLGL